MSDVYADLNEALAAQMAKLQSIDPRDAEQMNLIIDQSEAVAELAEKIVANNNSKIAAIKLFDQIGVEASALVPQHAKLLGDGR